jgi:ATP-binding cassette subfamily F protein 3
VALAKVIVSKANFLMLDEPTNHLDMHSCDLLIESLNKYQGTIILVSHDRYFVAKTANKIWEIVDQEIKEFKGGYEEWVAWKERMAKQKSEIGIRKPEVKSQKFEVQNPKSERKNPQPATSDQQPESSIQNPASGSKTAINKDLKKELQRMQKQFQQLEEKIAALTLKKNELESSLIDPATYSDKSRFQQAESAYQAAAAELKKLNKQYEEVFEKIMELEK